MRWDLSFENIWFKHCLVVLKSSLVGVREHCLIVHLVQDYSHTASWLASLVTALLYVTSSDLVLVMLSSLLIVVLLVQVALIFLLGEGILMVVCGELVSLLVRILLWSHCLVTSNLLLLLHEVILIEGGFEVWDLESLIAISWSDWAVLWKLSHKGRT